MQDLEKAGTEYETESQKKMKIGNYVGDKWGGKYLRAPDIFFTILEKGKDKFVKLGDIADVRRGFTTGANEFFYLTDAQVKEWEIESEFLKPVIKSPRECKSILVNPKELKYKIFICKKSKKELKGTNALKYIEWGEKQKVEITLGKDKGKIIMGFHNLETIKGRKCWWSLSTACGNIFWGKEIRERLATFISKIILTADCRLYYATLDLSVRIFCNATLYCFLGEVLKRDLGGGGGPRSLMVYEVQESLIVDPQFCKAPTLDTTKFLIEREIKTIFEECGIDPKSEIPIEEQEPNPLPDRAELDKIVFDALGLTEHERKDVYRAVCRLVWNRISKAKSV